MLAPPYSRQYVRAYIDLLCTPAASMSLRSVAIAATAACATLAVTRTSEDKPRTRLRLVGDGEKEERQETAREKTAVAQQAAHEQAQ